VSRSAPRSVSLPLTDELAAVFGRMSGLLMSEETVETALGLLSSVAQETVPGSSGAGVSIIDQHQRRSSGATDGRVRQADNLQYELGEGPCLTATIERRLVRMDDLATDRRWPRWSSAARSLGLHAAMSAPLVAGERAFGAIKVYADRPAVFDTRSEELLGLFAAQAAILVAGVQPWDRGKRLSQDMRDAFRSRDVVNMAKGVLMGRNGVDEDGAIAMLLARSEQDGCTVADAAEALVASSVRRRR
jgi:transcriptional regulator with GAF, ATPase, and Fis domain